VTPPGPGLDRARMGIERVAGPPGPATRRVRTAPRDARPREVRQTGERVGTAAAIASHPTRGGPAGDVGSDDVRDLWTHLKERVGSALDRVHPGVLIVGGLAAVVIAFGALGLTMLADDGSGLDDLGLGAPPGRPEDGDSASGTGGAGGGGVGGDSLSEGLTTRGPGGGGSGGDGPAGAAGTGENAMADGRAPSPAADEGSPATPPPTTRPTTTSAAVPRTTAPATTAIPPSTPTTTAPPHDPGLIGGLLDVLGLG
jgi:hypothetical protein